MENIQEGQLVFKDNKILRLGERIEVESNVRDIYIRKSLKSIYTLLRHLHRLNPCPLYSPGENSNIFIVVLSETAPLCE